MLPYRLTEVSEECIGSKSLEVAYVSLLTLIYVSEDELLMSWQVSSFNVHARPWQHKSSDTPVRR